MQTTIEKAAGRVAALDKSIAWQQYVVQTTRDPQQKARCQAAIERLKQQRLAIIDAVTA